MTGYRSVASPNLAVCSLALCLGYTLVHICSKHGGDGGEDRKYVAAHEAVAYREEVSDDEGGKPVAHSTKTLSCSGILRVG